jgi:hypothetical protein
MKFLRFILVVVVAWLIVLWLWKLTHDTSSFEDSKVLAPLRQKLVHKTTDTQIVKEEEVKIPIKKDTNTVASRISQELIPELSKWSLTLGGYNELLTLWSVHWNSNADYLMIQYCDYSMTFCRQAQREWALIAYQDALEWNLWYMLKPVLLESNTASEIQHHALLCAQKLWNESQVNRMHALLFQRSDRNEIRKTWNELDIEWFESCLLEESSRKDLINERSLATDLFSIKQLPGYIFIDTRTLEWTLIPWLYEEKLVTTYLQQVSK